MWKERGIKSYSFVQSKHAGGMTNVWNGGPVIIEVIDGHTKKLKAGKEPVLVQSSIEEDFADFKTVDKLFDYILNRLESGELVEARFDPEFGFPRFVQFTLHYLHGHNWQTIQIPEFRPTLEDRSV